MLLMYLSRVALEGQDYGSAEAYIAQSLELQHRLGDDKNINLAYSYDVLGRVAAAAGDDALARAHHRKSLELRRALGHRPGVLNSRAARASLAFRAGDAEHAALLWGGAEAARQTPPPGLTPPRERQEMAAAKAQLGEERFAAAWARGRRLGLEQTVAAALGAEMEA